ncbi:type III-A CRISPR-associated RAMP protein Csm3 [Stygiobacter electus]|uniref:CRISPR system Cms endoribonuclease Csm3 n=1 Tax=Stygiobacter electus TaxID=3032292 RepID=A0AAE3P012_9BACT|nr:type III-A CRISPR-associated RAMP protein Csm3 [Stygiobacter electus]MDF1610553.1 type III-A CRISPR-associated RAMP protein Csm3 [Stygiobacter electus]
MTNNKGQLVKKILIEGTITTKTGLHIGGSSVGMSIGGADATVVRNPITNEPYIPGSSLKGKMRSLLEKVEGKFGPPQDKNIIHSPNVSPEKIEEGDSDEVKKIKNNINTIIKVFGTMPEKIKGTEDVPSRLIVRDCELEGIMEDGNLITRDKGGVKKLFESKNTDMPYTEVKTEVVIDRITSAATPRQLERVPAGAVFNMRMILNVYNGDDEKAMLDKIFEGLALVQNDYLGGKGTRGSGEVDIKISNLTQKTKVDYELKNNWQEILVKQKDENGEEKNLKKENLIPAELNK